MVQQPPVDGEHAELRAMQHVLLFESHPPEQQSMGLVQLAPLAPHEGASAPPSDSTHSDPSPVWTQCCVPLHRMPHLPQSRSVSAHPLLQQASPTLQLTPHPPQLAVSFGWVQAMFPLVPLGQQLAPVGHVFPHAPQFCASCGTHDELSPPPQHSCPWKHEKYPGTPLLGPHVQAPAVQPSPG
jgi:hypothetical protein